MFYVNTFNDLTKRILLLKILKISYLFDFENVFFNIKLSFIIIKSNK
jgi:hypothetical protein